MTTAAYKLTRLGWTPELEDIVRYGRLDWQSSKPGWALRQQLRVGAFSLRMNLGYRPSGTSIGKLEILSPLSYSWETLSDVSYQMMSTYYHSAGEMSYARVVDEVQPVTEQLLQDALFALQVDY